MSKSLDKLKNLVHDSFKEVDTQEGVKTLALFDNAIKECEEEENDFLEKHKTLVNDYKELLMSQGTDKKPADDVQSGQPINFDSFLNDFVAKNKNN